MNYYCIIVVFQTQRIAIFLPVSMDFPAINFVIRNQEIRDYSIKSREARLNRKELSGCRNFHTRDIKTSETGANVSM